MEFVDYKESFKKILDEISPAQIMSVVTAIEDAVGEHRRIFIIGNGGSAALSSHFANDLAKCSVGGRRIKAISLAENISLITMIANDFCYADIFSKQLAPLVEEGDLLIAISGSGSSANILNAAKLVNERGGKVIGLIGFDGGDLAQLCEQNIHIKSNDYGIIETAHAFVGHMIVTYFSKKINS